MHEKKLKQALLRDLNPREGIALEEFSILHNAARVDVAIVSKTIHGYELKSDHDTLVRLSHQIVTYRSCLDRLTVVVAERHLKNLRRIPDWVGVSVAIVQDGDIELEQVRVPVLNTEKDPICVARLLWKEEAIAILEELGCDYGVRTKPREYAYERLAETMDAQTLTEVVCYAVRSRY